MSDDRERKESKVAITVNENGQLNNNNKKMLRQELSKPKPDEKIINQCLKGVEELNFGVKNGIVNPGQNIEPLLRCLPTCTRLRSFALNGLVIHKGMATLLAEQLPKCQSLETLDLSDNKIDAESAKILAPILPKLSNLHTFNINNVTELEDGLNAFAAVLPECPTLRKLGIRNTHRSIEDIGVLGKGLLRSGITHLDLIKYNTSGKRLLEVASWLKFNGVLVSVGKFSEARFPEELKLQQTIKDALKKNQNLLNSDVIQKVEKKHLQNILLPDLASVVKDYLNNDITAAPELLNFLVTTHSLAEIIKWKLAPADQLNHYRAIFSTKNAALNYAVDVESFLRKADSLKKTDKIADKIILKVYKSGEAEFTLDIAITPTQVYLLAEKMRQFPTLIFKREEKGGVWKPANVQQTHTAYPTSVHSGNLPASLSTDAKRNSPLEIKRCRDHSDNKQSVRPADPITAEQLIPNAEPSHISLTEQKAIIELIRKEILSDKSGFGLNPTNTESLLEVQTVEGIQVWILSCLTPEQNQTLKNKFIDKLEEVSPRNQDSTYRACWQVLSGMDSTLANLSAVAAKAEPPIKDREKKKNPSPSAAGTPSFTVSAPSPSPSPLPSGPGSLGIFSSSSSSFASSLSSPTSLKPGSNNAEKNEDKSSKTRHYKKPS